MKYEIIKGSEKDFEGLNDGVMRVFKSATGSLLYSDVGAFVGAHWNLIAERRPITELVWSGEGLPPVGVECKHLPAKHCSVPHKVTILAHTKLDSRDIDVAVFQYGDVISFSDANQFMPIRSPEDVARYEAVAAMREVLGHAARLIEVSNIYRAIAAGKIPGITLSAK